MRAGGRGGRRIAELRDFRIMVLDDFEWDDDKAAENIRKHRIDFMEAMRVFDDPLYIVKVDDDAFGEQRFVAIGYAPMKPLAVTYTERADRIRIISARKATRHEQRLYHQG